MLGVRSSAIFTNIFTFVNVSVVLLVIIGGAANGKFPPSLLLHNLFRLVSFITNLSLLANGDYWSIPKDKVPPGFGDGGFLPYGFAGVMAGAAKCFFAFVGFDSIASTGFKFFCYYCHQQNKLSQLKK